MSSLLAAPAVLLTAPPLAVPPSILTPVQVGFASNATGNPTVPAHQAGDTLVSIASSSNAHSGVAPSVTTSGWTLWDDIVAGTNRSLAIWRITAAGAGTLCEWTGANAPRTVWVYRDADFDLAIAAESPETNTIDWSALTGMAADCLVGAYALARNTQTNVDVIALSGFNTRVSKESAPACWAGDSDPTLLDTFDPANDAWDTTTSGQCHGVFSMKGAAA